MEDSRGTTTMRILSPSLFSLFFVFQMRGGVERVVIIVGGSDGDAAKIKEAVSRTRPVVAGKLSIEFLEDPTDPSRQFHAKSILRARYVSFFFFLRALVFSVARYICAHFHATFVLRARHTVVCVVMIFFVFVYCSRLDCSLILSLSSAVWSKFVSFFFDGARCFPSRDTCTNRGFDW